MPANRIVTIIALDPAVKDSAGKILRTKISIPHENLNPGPRGYRVHVVDYDTSQRVLYQPSEIPDDLLIQMLTILKKIEEYILDIFQELTAGLSIPVYHMMLSRMRQLML